jgi:hypothetical protein
MRVTRRHTAAIVLGGLIATGTTGAGALANTSFSARVKPGLAVVITTRTVTPKIQRTVGFNGYATYTFRPPKGRRIVSASARIAGAQAHAVVIQGRSISHNRTRYTVRLRFPGEQGNPGRLVVRLGSIG